MVRARLTGAGIMFLISSTMNNIRANMDGKWKFLSPDDDEESGDIW